MKKSFRLFLAVLFVCGAPIASAQKQRFASLDEALASSSALSGRQGPRSVNWIDNGARFSFIDRDARTGRSTIKAYDPATGRDTTLFTGDGLVFPGSTEPFSYD